MNRLLQNCFEIQHTQNKAGERIGKADKRNIKKIEQRESEKAKG